MSPRRPTAFKAQGETRTIHEGIGHQEAPELTRKLAIKFPADEQHGAPLCRFLHNLVSTWVQGCPKIASVLVVGGFN